MPLCSIAGCELRTSGGVGGCRGAIPGTRPDRFLRRYSGRRFGMWVSHVRPDSGEMWVNPDPAGGLGMRIR